MALPAARTVLAFLVICGSAALVPSLASTQPADASQAGRAEGEVDVALDPGHSSWDVGAASAGLREFEVTLDIALRAEALLLGRGYTVRTTRRGTGRVTASLPADPTEAIRAEQEARHAAAAPTRVYVSIHLNGHPDRSIRGTETYFNAENHGALSRSLASSIQTQLVMALRLSGYGSVDRGVREDLAAGKPYGHFFSLRGPFPSVVVEALYLSNPEDAQLLHLDAVREAIADGIARGIAAFLEGEALQ